MKRVLLSVLLLPVCISVSSAEIKIFAEDIGGQKIRISYEVLSGSILPVGFGLDVTADSGAVFDSITYSSSLFSYYPGTILIDSGNVIDLGTPIAPETDPGALGGLGTGGVTLEMSLFAEMKAVSDDPRDFNGDGLIDNLDHTIFNNDWLMSGYVTDTDLNGNGLVNLEDYAILVESRFDAPPLSGVLLEIQLDLDEPYPAYVALSGNSARGNIVGDNAEQMSVAYYGTSVAVPEPCTLLILTIGGLVLLRRNTV
jgi:hypothetical protein